MPRGGFGTARGAGLTPAKRHFALPADDPLAAKVAARVRGVAGAVGAAENHTDLQVIGVVRSFLGQKLCRGSVRMPSST